MTSSGGNVQSILNRFYHPAAETAARDVRSALDDLLGRGDVAGATMGALTTWEFWDLGEDAPVPGGPACPALFGGPDDDTRIAHISLPCLLLHPALAPTVGERLGISEKQALAVAKFKAWLDGTKARGRPRGAPDSWLDEHAEASGVEALRQALIAAGQAADELFCEALPVPPLALRPFEIVREQAFSDDLMALLGDVLGAAGTQITVKLGRETLALQKLIGQAEVYARLRSEPRCPTAVLRDQSGTLQRVFEAVVESMAQRLASPTLPLISSASSRPPTRSRS